MSKKPKDYSLLSSITSQRPIIIAPAMPDVISAPVYTYNAKECTFEGELVDHKLFENGMPTKFGQEILAAQNNAAAYVGKLPAYLNRIAVISGTSVELPATNLHSSFKEKDNNSFFDPPTKRVVIPSTSSKFPDAVGRRTEDLNHEMNHAADRALAGMLAKPFAAKDGIDARLSEHPLFAQAYERDLARIKDDPDRQWTMDLTHYLPQVKGGRHDSKFNNFMSRTETFAELLAYVQKGYAGADKTFSDYGKNAYSNALKNIFPNTFAVVEKFHADMIKLEKQNPVVTDASTGLPNNDKYTQALGKFLNNDLPKTPDAYLDKAVTARLATLPDHKDETKIAGSKEQVKTQAAPDACIDIKVRMKGAAPAQP